MRYNWSSVKNATVQDDIKELVRIWASIDQTTCMDIPHLLSFFPCQKRCYLGIENVWSMKNIYRFSECSKQWESFQTIVIGTTSYSPLLTSFQLLPLVQFRNNGLLNSIYICSSYSAYFTRRIYFISHNLKLIMSSGQTNPNHPDLLRHQS